MLISRQDAKRSGLRRYFTGAFCSNGHEAERFVSSKGCVACAADQRVACREGNREYARHYYAANRERELARGREKEARPETKAKRLETRKANADKHRIIKRAWRDANPEKARESVRRHYANNRQAYRVRDRNRRAAVAEVGGRHTLSDIQALMVKQYGECVYCRVDIIHSFHVDHVMPIALGGSNGPTNLQLLCPACNFAKGAEHPDRFAEKVRQKI